MAELSVEEAVQQLRDTAPDKEEPKEAPVEESAETPDEPEVEAEAVEQEPADEDGSLESAEVTPEVEAEQGAETVELEADQFAELLGIKSDYLDINDDGKVVFKAKEGDKVVDVNLEKLINAYQGDANLTNRSKEIAEAAKQKQAELANLQQQTQQFAQQSAALIEGLKKQYLDPFDNIDWKQLREDDPAEYAAQMAEKRKAEESLSQFANQAVEQISQQQATQSEEMQRQYNDYLAQQEKMLMDSKSPLHIPGLEKTYPEIRSYMSEKGFTDQEINQVSDARILNMMYKSMMYDKGAEGVKRKLAKPLPKVLKPGKAPSKTEVSMEQTQKMRNKLKQSGDMEDAIALLRTQRSK